MRKGKIERANALADKIGRLMSQQRSEILQQTNANDTRDLWAAVNNFRSKGHNNLYELGHPFNDCDAINKLFADVASDPMYNRQNVMSFIHECNSEYTGSEPIPYWVYKHCAIELVPVVTHIFNLTLSCG